VTEQKLWAFFMQQEMAINPNRLTQPGQKVCESSGRTKSRAGWVSQVTAHPHTRCRAGLCRSGPFGVSGPRENGPEILSSHSEITNGGMLRKGCSPALHGSIPATHPGLPTPVCASQRLPAHPSQHCPEVSNPACIVLHVSATVTLSIPASITLGQPASPQGIHPGQHHAIPISSVTLSPSASPACPSRHRQTNNFSLEDHLCPPLKLADLPIYTHIVRLCSRLQASRGMGGSELPSSPKRRLQLADINPHPPGSPGLKSRGGMLRGGMLQPWKGTLEQLPALLLRAGAHGRRQNCVAKKTRATR